MNNDLSLNTVFYRALDLIGRGGTNLLVTGGNVFIPVILGNIGGRFAGVGAQVGMFQGLTSGTYHQVVHLWFQDKVTKGHKTKEISTEAMVFWRLVGLVCGAGVPIILTAKFGDVVVNKTLARLPEGFIKRCLFSQPTKEYNVWSAIWVNISPMIAQYCISALRKEDPRHQK